MTNRKPFPSTNVLDEWDEYLHAMVVNNKNHEECCWLTGKRECKIFMYMYQFSISIKITCLMSFYLGLVLILQFG